MAIKSLIFKTLVFAAVVCTSGTNNGKPAIAHLQQEKRPQMEDRYPGLSVSPSGQLMLNDSPFKGVGVNYFNAFIRTLDQGHTDDTSYLRGFAYLQERKIPFIRFALNGYWPNNWDLYLKHPDRFFENLDDFVKAAEHYKIGLIPSFFWHTPTVPDLVAEPVNEWGNPDSKTSALMRKFVREVVLRYRDSPAIWGWEQGNEVNLLVDLPGDNDHLPPTVPSLGTPAIRYSRDKLNSRDLIAMMEEFAREVRRYDNTRIVISGNAIPRQAAHHLWHHQSWQTDDKQQFMDILGKQNPDPLDVISIHLYPSSTEEGYFSDGEADMDKLIATSMEASRRHGKPLFLGEFGTQELKLGPKIARSLFLDVLSSIEKNGVPLSAMWVFDYPPHDGEEGINVSSSNGPREYMLEGIMKLNERLASGTRVTIEK